MTSEKYLKTLTLVKLGQRLFYFGCLVGFLFQSSQISSDYFKFETRALSTQDMEVYLPMPNLAICVKYDEIYNKAAVFSEKNKKNGNKIKFIMNKDIDSLEKILTIKEIFQFTPDTNHIMTFCAYRSSTTYQIEHYNSSECYEKFHLSKFYMMQYVCFSFNPIKKDQFMLDQIASSIYMNGIFYMVQVCKLFTRVIKLMPILYYNSLPDEERDFAPYFMLGARIPHSAYSLRIEFDLIKVDKLPPPFDTRCKYNYYKSNCMKNCKLNKLKQIKRVPSSEILTQSYNLPHTSDRDTLRNRTQALFIAKIDDFCRNVCLGEPCNYNFTITYGDAYFEDKAYEYIRIRVGKPQKPITALHFEAKISLTDFIIYLSSTFGIWFGLSFYDLNPFNYVMIRMKKEKQINYLEKRPKRVYRCYYCPPRIKSSEIVYPNLRKSNEKYNFYSRDL